MKNRKSVFLIMIHFSYVLIGMDVVPPKATIPGLCSDVGLIVANNVLDGNQWWYCDQTIKQSNKVGSVNLSGSEDRLAAVCRDQDVRMLDTATQEKLVSFKFNYFGWFRSFSISSCGGRFVEAWNGENAEIFDLFPKKKIVCFKHPDARVTSVSLSSSGDSLATGCNDGNVRIFDTNIKKQMVCFKHPDGIRSVSLSSGGNLLATSCNDENARIFDVVTKKELVCFNHPGRINSVSLSISGNCLAIAGNDNNVRIFDTVAKKELACFQHPDYVRSVSLSSGGDCLATRCNDENVRIFKRYTDYTLDQILLKCAFFKWLTLERSNKSILRLETQEMIGQLLNDVIQKCELDREKSLAVWSTFPMNMQNSILRTIMHRIEKYGKDSSMSCCIQ